MDCIFCKIAAGEIPSKKAYEDDKILAFYDIEPQAPVHILIVPKMHISSCDDISSDNAHIIAHIFATIPTIVKNENLTNGYRVVTNCGTDGGQTVAHLHFHLLGGRSLAWPPG